MSRPPAEHAAGRRPLPGPAAIFCVLCWIAAAACLVAAPLLYRLLPEQPSIFAGAIRPWRELWVFSSQNVPSITQLYAALLLLASAACVFSALALHLRSPHAPALCRALCLGVVCLGTLILVLAPYYAPVLERARIFDPIRGGAGVLIALCIVWYAYFGRAPGLAQAFGCDKPRETPGPTPPLSVGLMLCFCLLLIANFGLPLIEGLVTFIPKGKTEKLGYLLPATLPPLLCAIAALALLVRPGARRGLLYFVLACCLLSLVLLISPLLLLSGIQGVGLQYIFLSPKLLAVWLALLWWLLAADKGNRFWLAPLPDPSGDSATGAGSPSFPERLVLRLVRAVRKGGVSRLSLICLAVIGIFILTWTPQYIFQFVQYGGGSTPWPVNNFFRSGLLLLCLLLPLLWLLAVALAICSHRLLAPVSSLLICLCPLLAVFAMGLHTSPAMPVAEMIGPLLLGLIFQPDGALVVLILCFWHFNWKAGPEPERLPIFLFLVFCLLRVVDYGVVAVTSIVSWMFYEGPPLQTPWAGLCMSAVTWIICPLLAFWAVKSARPNPGGIFAQAPDRRDRWAIYFWICCIVAAAL
ncbi:hypothetical protein LJC59_07165, partial [Desulfovibrio sp. OttesenSCG-928-A18]|nr:hypothetical protein [Desulfovibrio sp. OttesenSCG-928-A18]